MKAEQERFMREAIRIARENVQQGRGGPFGAVVVFERQIVGCGANLVTATNDPTAHAEIVALREACRVRRSFLLEGCQVYCTCEPCPMCLSALYWARISKLFYAADRNDAADAGFLDEFLYQEFAKSIGSRRMASEQMLRAEAQSVLAEWKAKRDKVAY